MIATQDKTGGISQIVESEPMKEKIKNSREPWVHQYWKTENLKEQRMHIEDQERADVWKKWDHRVFIEVWKRVFLRSGKQYKKLK